MTWQLTPYTVPLALSTALGFVAAVVVFRRRDSRAEAWGTLVQLSIAAWALVHLLVVSSVGFGPKVFWFAFVLPVVSCLVITLFCFTLHYTGRKALLTRRRVALLVAFPVAVLATSVTNGYHELLFVDVGLDTGGQYARLTYGWGPVFYVLAVVHYALSSASVAMLYLKFRRSRNVYRKLSFVLFASVVVLTGGRTTRARRRE